MADAIKAFGLELNENADKERSTLSLSLSEGWASLRSLDRTKPLTHPLPKIVNSSPQTAIEALAISKLHCRRMLNIKRATILRIAKNSQTNVSRILHRFGLKGTDQVTLSASGHSAGHLPLGRPVSLHDLLSYSVEVQEAATRAQIRELAAFTVCPPHRRELEELSAEGVYQEQILKNEFPCWICLKSMKRATCRLNDF